MRTSRASRTILVASLFLAVVGACAIPGAEPPPASSDLAVPTSAPTVTAPHSPDQGSGAAPPIDVSPPSLAPLPVGGQLASVALRYQRCDINCWSSPPLIVLEDGRVLRETEVGMTERQLTPAGMQQIRDALDATGLFTQDASFEPILNPGQQPGGFGPAMLSFDVGTESGQVHVTTSEVDAYAADNTRGEIWTIPPESHVLEELGAKLAELDGWLPADAWAGPAKAHLPDHYLLIVTAERGVIPAPFHGTYPDADAVAWALGGRIESLGAPYEPPEGSEGRSRCLTVDRQTAERIAAAEGAATEDRDRSLWLATDTLTYAWHRGPGGIDVTLRMVLPYQLPTCAAAGRW